jgi:hypothetical protein
MSTNAEQFLQQLEIREAIGRNWKPNRSTEHLYLNKVMPELRRSMLSVPKKSPNDVKRTLAEIQASLGDNRITRANLTAQYILSRPVSLLLDSATRMVGEQDKPGYVFSFDVAYGMFRSLIVIPRAERDPQSDETVFRQIVRDTYSVSYGDEIGSDDEFDLIESEKSYTRIASNLLKQDTSGTLLIGEAVKAIRGQRTQLTRKYGNLPQFCVKSYAIEGAILAEQLYKSVYSLSAVNT